MIAHDLHGFIRAILAEPDRSDHALVYADWLEEQGDILRAERIRNQVAAEAMEHRFPLGIGRAGHDEWTLVRERREQLDQVDCRPLRDPPPKEYGWTWGSRYDGLARRVRVRSLEAFLEHPPWREWPEPVTGLGLALRDASDLEKVATLPEAAFLTELRIRLDSWDRAHQLIDLPARFPALRSLHVDEPDSEGSRADLLELLRQRRWRSLRFQRQDKAWSVERFAQIPELADLEFLAMPRNRLADRDLIALIESPHLANLRALDLSENGIGRRGCRRLAEGTPGWPSLEQVSLRNNRIDGRAAAALAHWGFVAGQLNWLDLRENQIGLNARATFPHDRVAFTIT